MTFALPQISLRRPRMKTVTVGQRIVFVDITKNRQHRDAYVIGSETDPEEGVFFWIFVPETKMVHVGITHSLHEKDGVEHFWEADMTRNATDLTERGDVAIFHYSRDPANRDAMAKNLRMHMLLT
jgi:hypothetical protein